MQRNAIESEAIHMNLHTALNHSCKQNLSPDSPREFSPEACMSQQFSKEEIVSKSFGKIKTFVRIYLRNPIFENILK